MYLILGVTEANEVVHHHHSKGLKSDAEAQRVIEHASGEPVNQVIVVSGSDIKKHFYTAEAHYDRDDIGGQ